jgi:hypothetical protein
MAVALADGSSGLRSHVAASGVECVMLRKARMRQGGGSASALLLPGSER